MNYIKITPAKARHALHAMADGGELQMPAWMLARYILRHGIQTSGIEKARAKNDFVQFAERLFALDAPQPGTESNDSGTYTAQS